VADIQKRDDPKNREALAKLDRLFKVRQAEFLRRGVHGTIRYSLTVVDGDITEVVDDSQRKYRGAALAP
jgi:hypothetical protein